MADVGATPVSSTVDADDRRPLPVHPVFTPPVVEQIEAFAVRNRRMAVGLLVAAVFVGGWCALTYQTVIVWFVVGCLTAAAAVYSAGTYAELRDVQRRRQRQVRA